jgi:hypothetical protein
MTDEPTERQQPLPDEGESGTAPHPSPAEGGGEAVERPPRPSQAEGDRDADDGDAAS